MVIISIWTFEWKNTNDCGRRCKTQISFKDGISFKNAQEKLKLEQTIEILRRAKYHEKMRINYIQALDKNYLLEQGFRYGWVMELNRVQLNRISDMNSWMMNWW